MLKESVEPFLDAIQLFASLQEKDEKGIASCLGLLSKCLGKLSLEDFEEIQHKFPDQFQKDHPCLESYVQGINAIKHIESLHESLYSSRHLVRFAAKRVGKTHMSEENRVKTPFRQLCDYSLMDHSTITQSFKVENSFSTVGKIFLNLVKL